MAASINDRRFSRVAVASVVTLLILVASIYTATLILGAINTMASHADEIDDQRALTAVAGAIEALKKQLGSTVRDNAYWDEAYKQISLPSREDWAYDTWGSVTKDYPLYDIALVYNPRDEPVASYHDGEKMELPPVLRGPKFNALLKKLRNSANFDPTLAFMTMPDGIALIGMAVIQPQDLQFDRSSGYVLLLAKTLRPAVVAELAETFKLQHLKLHTEKIVDRLSVPLKDGTGTTISYFSVQSQRPGTASYHYVFGRIVTAGFLLFGILWLIGFIGSSAVRGARRRELASLHQANHDALTGLLNRDGFCHAADGELVHRMLDWVIYLFDLDDLKAINEMWGYPVGDQVLKSIAGRMTELLPGSSLSTRLSGDRFCFVYPTHAKDEVGIFLDELMQPCRIGDRTIAINLRIAEVPRVTGDAEELLRRGVIALDRARSLGRGARVRYEPCLDEKLLEERLLEDELRAALQAHELTVAFQPLVDSRTGELKGAETLARWSRAKHGTVPPDRFIPIAEKSGLIDELGRQVLELSLATSKHWKTLSISVNVSPAQLRNPNFVKDLRGILAKHDFPPERLVIEITESALVSDTARAKEVLDEIKRMGVRLALDDFGAGFASIGMLKQFNFDCLKLDRSLITALDNDDTAGAVLQATAALATTMRLAVTAEGIETQEQATIAMLAGCQQLQGYLFGKPMDANAFARHYAMAAASIRTVA